MRPSFISATATVFDRPVVSRQDRLDPGIAGDPIALTELSQRNQAKTEKVLADVSSIRELGAIVFEKVALDTTKETTLRHGLSRRVFWQVIDWESTPLAAPSAYKVSQDADTITFKAGANGTAWIKVW